ncbi:MAG: ABC transporter substrate-binding protein [Schleiferiaceae bacterium]|nr:ABC transporter substrate-binding protein [Schleiferiaceae bacterium]
MWKIVVFVAVVAMGCSSTPDVPGAVFRYNEAAGITSLDPAFARVQSNIWAVNQLFDGLVYLDEHLQPQPRIAVDWDVSQDGKRYTFTIDTSIVFHPHAAFNQTSRNVRPSDVLFSLQRLADPRLAAPGSWIVRNIDTLFSDAPNRVTIVLHAPFAPFLSLLAMPYAMIVPEVVVKQLGDAFGRSPIGTGPFYMKRWIENEKLVLRKNVDYFLFDAHARRLPYLESVAIRFIPDKQSGFMEFLKGNLELLSGLDPSYKDEMLTPLGALNDRYTSVFQMSSVPYLNTEYLGFFIDKKSTHPLQNPLVRQAINYGFDRELMIQYLKNGVGTPATAGFVPPGLAGSLSLGDGYHYDPQKAADLLAEAGYPNGKGLPPIPLQTTAAYLDICEYIQSQLKPLGIIVQVDVSPPSTLRQAVATGKSLFFRGSWIADYADAENYLSLFYSKNHSPNGPNYTHFEDEQFDSWYEQARTTSDAELREALYQKMDSLAMTAAPVVPLFYDQVVRFYPKSIKGLEANPLNLLDLRRVRLEEETP